MKDIPLYLVVGFIAVIVLASIYGSIEAMYNCGFGNTVLYGKNILWAYWMGYCD